MPSNFLSDQNIRDYANFSTNPNEAQLQTYFSPSAADHEIIKTLRYDHTKLGFAIQLGTLKFLGAFLDDPIAVPEIVIDFVKTELDIRKEVRLGLYAKAKDTRFLHRSIIREHLGFKVFAGSEVKHLLQFLYARAAMTIEQPMVLFDLATRELVSRNVILPGATTLAKVIVAVQDRVARRLYRRLSRKLKEKQKVRLSNLLIVENPQKDRRTPLEQLRKETNRANSTGLRETLLRLKKIREVGVSNVDLSDVPESHLNAIGRQAAGLWAKTIADYSVDHRQAVLLVAIQFLERSATDEILSIFRQVIDGLELKRRKQSDRENLKHFPANLEAISTLRSVAVLLRDESISVAQLRKAIYQHLPASQIDLAIAQTKQFAMTTHEAEKIQWLKAAKILSLFLHDMISEIHFDATPAGQPVLAALKFLRATRNQPASKWPPPPKDFITETWRKLLFQDRVFQRPMFVVYTAIKLRDALKGRNVFVAKSHDHTDPRAKLLSGQRWQEVKPNVTRALGLNNKAAPYIQHLSKTLSIAYLEAQKTLFPTGIPKNKQHGFTPHAHALDAIEPTETLLELETALTHRFPEVELPELLLEVDAKLDFTTSMTNATRTKPIAKDLATSIVAVIIAKACNIGLRAVTQKSVAALELNRLSHVQQAYLTRESLQAANAKIVEFHSNLELTKKFGDGEIASADGLRFLVPVRSTQTRANPKYFGVRRGITFYTLTSDQYTMLHGIVIPGTLRDSLFILAAVLEQTTTLEPTEIMTDTHGYSDHVFGLFHLLGHTFSPRIKDITDLRYWRVDKNINHGIFNSVAKQKINTNRIADHWEDILRLVGSLKVGVVKAPDVMLVLTKNGSLSGLGQAVADIGRVAKTLYLLRYISDESYRRRIQTQLNRGEFRGRIAREVFYGQKGELRQKFRSGMENQLNALGFVVNVIALWNTLYLDRVLKQLVAEGVDVLDEDVSRLSPLRWEHIHFLGRYSFELSPDVAGGDFRPLRDPFVFEGELLL